MKHRSEHDRRTRTTAALLAAGLGLTALVAVASPAAGQVAVDRAAATAAPHRPGKAATVDPVSWAPCMEGFDCATVQVPLDHDRPDGPTIDIALVRAPATSPDRRIGSLFLNPGGPGGSGIELALGITPFMPRELRERFDIVGFDPRGVGSSTPLRCYPTLAEALADVPVAPYPATTAEEDLQIAADRRLVDACRHRAGPILTHMSTADVARDLDLLREAVGDRTLTYFGASYGAVLGQTYANLYPDRVRALALDAVPDPRAWVGEGPEGSTVPIGTRMASARSAQQTLEEFFRLCDEAGPACAFSGDASERFAALMAKLRVAPMELPGGQGTVTDSSLTAQTLSGLYFRGAWPDTARLLQQVEAAAPAADIRATVETLRVTLGADEPPAQEAYPNRIEASVGVACADAANPRGHRRYREAADAAEDEFGYFGRRWTWAWSPCAVWPAEARADRYDGPWTARTANPVLLVGNLYDPATGYHGAVAASQLLENSRLLTYTGWGHTAFLSGDPCVDQTIESYLVSPSTPDGDVVCQAQGSPFTAVGAQAATVPHSLVAPTIPEPLRRALNEL